mmetsp:Transcript_26208/g.38413  ORF Transcript_26208/g.38413 Transcript_26208/m.38413 type:complete len:104 (-) Transcript_26208:692-1003(-)
MESSVHSGVCGANEHHDKHGRDLDVGSQPILGFRDGSFALEQYYQARDSTTTKAGASVSSFYTQSIRYRPPSIYAETARYSSYGAPMRCKRSQKAYKEVYVKL